MIQRLPAAIRVETAQTLAEYGLIMAFLVVPIVLLAVTGLREQIVGAFETAVSAFP